MEGWKFGTVVRGGLRYQSDKYTLMIVGQNESSATVKADDGYWVTPGQWIALGLALPFRADPATVPFLIGETNWLPNEGDWTWEVVE